MIEIVIIERQIHGILVRKDTMIKKTRLAKCNVIIQSRNAEAAEVKIADAYSSIDVRSARREASSQELRFLRGLYKEDAVGCSWRRFLEVVNRPVSGDGKARSKTMVLVLMAIF